LHRKTITAEAMTMLTDSIKTYFAGALVVLLLMILIPTGLANMALKVKLGNLENEKTTLLAEAMIKRMELSALSDAIGEQSKKVVEFEATTKKMAQARLAAQEKASTRINQLQAGIARLQQENAQGCTAEGIRSKILRELSSEN
jgi:hypothetical protein